MSHTFIKYAPKAMITAFFLLVAINSVLSADPVAGNAAPGTENTIRVAAQKLIADIDGDTAEFSGDVRIDRGQMWITSDYLKLYYDRSAGPDALKQLDKSAVEKIEARGKVRIRYKDISARSDRAVYHTKTEKLILEGRKTTVSKGGNSIQGSRMVLAGDGQDFTVVGDAGARVKAIIATGGKLF